MLEIRVLSRVVFRSNGHDNDVEFIHDPHSRTLNLREDLNARRTMEILAECMEGGRYSKITVCGVAGAAR